MSFRLTLYQVGVCGYRWLDSFGLNLEKSFRAFRGLADYIKDAHRFASHPGILDFHFKRGTPFPCLEDRYMPSGTAKGAYFYQDLLTAQKIFQKNPERHLDVGSSVSGFVAHVAAFRQIEVIDIRPLSSQASNIHFHRADITAELEVSLVDCCDSLSCLHALEHFGLGRYGDPINPLGFILGWNNLHRMLKTGGTLYFAAPLGDARIEFNGQRIFSIQHILRLIDTKYEIIDFAYVDDHGDLHNNLTHALHGNAAAINFDCHVGNAIFELTKL